MNYWFKEFFSFSWNNKSIYFTLQAWRTFYEANYLRFIKLEYDPVGAA